MEAVASPSTGGGRGGGGETSTHAAYSAADINRTCPQRWLQAVRRAKMKPTLHITLFLLFVIVSVVIILIVVFASWPEQREEEEKRRLNFTKYRFDESGLFRIPSLKPPSAKTTTEGAKFLELNETSTTLLPPVNHHDHDDSISEESSHHRNVFVQNSAELIPDLQEATNETSLLLENDTRSDGTAQSNETLIVDALNSTDISDFNNPALKGSVVDVPFFVDSEEPSVKLNFASDMDKGAFEYPQLLLPSENMTPAGTNMLTVHIGQATLETDTSSMFSLSPFFETNRYILPDTSSNDSSMTEQAHFFINDTSTKDEQSSSGFDIQATPSLREDVKDSSIINTVEDVLNVTTVSPDLSPNDNELSSLFLWYGNMNDSANLTALSSSIADSSTPVLKGLLSSSFNEDSQLNFFSTLNSPVVVALNASPTELLDQMLASKELPSFSHPSTFVPIQESWNPDHLILLQNGSRSTSETESAVSSVMTDNSAFNYDKSVIATAPPADRSASTSLTTDTTSLATSFSQTIQVSDANDYIIRYILKMESTSALSTTYDPNIRTTSAERTISSSTTSGGLVLMLASITPSLTSDLETSATSDSARALFSDSTDNKSSGTSTDASSATTTTTTEKTDRRSHAWLPGEDENSGNHSRKNMVGEVEEAPVDSSVQAGSHWPHELAFPGIGSEGDEMPDEVGFFPESFTESSKQVEETRELDSKSLSTTSMPNGNALDALDSEIFPDESSRNNDVKKPSNKLEKIEETTTTEEPCSGSSVSDMKSFSENPNSGTSAAKDDVMSAECRPRTLPFCDEVATYNATYLPNLAGAITETEKWQLAYYYNSILDWTCNLWLKEYMCYILEPICVENIAVPPCNGLCRVAKKGCEKYISKSPSLEAVFQCESYPQASAQVLCAGLGNGEPCRDTEFRCSDGTCIPATWRCDGVPDCEQADDEKQCLHQSGVVGISTV